MKKRIFALSSFVTDCFGKPYNSLVEDHTQDMKKAHELMRMQFSDDKNSDNFTRNASVSVTTPDPD